MVFEPREICLYGGGIERGTFDTWVGGRKLARVASQPERSCNDHAKDRIF